MSSNGARWFVAVALVGTGALRLLAQTPAFDVVSVKPSPPPSAGALRIGVGVTPGRWDASFVTLLNVIRNAYPELATEAQFVGGPEWIRTTRFDIAATMAGDPTRDQLRDMVRDLLVRRFGVKTRVESRAMDAYALVVARSDGRLGPNLRRSTVDCEARAAAIKRGERQPDSPTQPGEPPARIECGMRSMLAIGRERIVVGAQHPSFILGTLTNAAGRRVVDRTGLTGVFDFELEYASERRQPRPDAAPDPNPAPSVFTAVQEQLGLKLEPRKELLDVLVIEDAQMPTPD
jgi:uncharacterized protein (TIGR03435 family)